MDNAFEDLGAALEFGATLDLTIEQRRSLTDLCVKIAGKLIPAYRLAESQELKKAAVARAEAAERRVIELEGALKYQKEVRDTEEKIYSPARDSASGRSGRGIVLTGVNNARRDRSF